MKAFSNAIMTLVLITGLAAPNLYAAKLTTGTPLGGFGASYIAYNGANGKFAKGYRLTGQHWYQEMLFNASFNLFTKVGTSVKNVPSLKSADEDALIPTYRVKYGAVNNIALDLLAFGPYVTGDEKSSVMPLAFFEFSVQNNNTSAAEAAVAFQISNLAGANPVRLEGGNGVAWFGTENSACVGTSDLASATITTGSALGNFNATGQLTDTDGGIVSVKLSLAPGQTGKIRFVVGWYQEFSDKDCNGTVQNEGFYYQNYITSATDAVAYGLNEFVRIRNGATDFVNRLRAVNLPDWYTDRLCNNLYPFIHNGQFAKDGRVAWREGKYFIIGTIDQQGHSQIASSYNWPGGQWRQSEFWLRTQWQGEYSGQIHHDFNGPKSGDEKINAMCEWDDHDHNDYWWSKTKNWSDLNSLTLINIYELFLTTGDTARLSALWPRMLLTGNRLLHQAKRCIDNQYEAPPAPYDSTTYVLPHNCLGSYDREGATNEYNATLALVAYAALKEMALSLGDATEAARWGDIFTRGREQFSTVYSSAETFGANLEAQLGAYNFSRHLGLPVIMDDAEAAAGFANYWIKSANGTDLLPWHFYTISHFADCGIAIGKVDEGLKIHKKDYDEHCVRNPEFYFWQDLDATPGMHSYMTAPVVWRSLFLITGYCLDKFNQRLWIRPMLPSENQGTLTDAPLISPGNWGTLNYSETGNGATQSVSIQFDKPMPVREIRLKNPTGTGHTVKVLGPDRTELPATITTSGTGLDAQLIISLTSPVHINSDGLLIGVDSDPFIGVQSPRKNAFRLNNLKIHSLRGTPVADFSLHEPGRITLEIFRVNGSVVKTIDLGMKTAGSYSCTTPSVASGVYLLRLLHNGTCRETTSFTVSR